MVPRVVQVFVKKNYKILNETEIFVENLLRDSTLGLLVIFVLQHGYEKHFKRSIGV